MEVLHPHGAGLDVHKDSVVACVRHRVDGDVKREVRSFKTTTKELMALSEWLSVEGCTHLVMEATGVYGKPVWHILSDGEFELVLANAAHVKNVPGRKTGVNDATPACAGAGLYGAFGVKWFDVDPFGAQAEPRLMFPLISISFVCCGACGYVGEGEHFPAFRGCSGSGGSGAGRRSRSSTYPQACGDGGHPRGARHRARTSRYTLVFGRSRADLDHDAVMRIGGEAPGRQAHSLGRRDSHACLGSPPPRIVMGSLA